YVLRCFDDDDITHVAGKIDPIADFEVVETELMLADLESLEKRRANLEKKAKGQDKEAKSSLLLVDKALEALREGKPARSVDIAQEAKKAWAGLQLLTAKPVLFVANVDEESAAEGNAYALAVEQRAADEHAVAVVISAKIESELAQLSDDEQAEYLETLGLEEPGLNRLIRAGYDLLDLQTYFTAGPKETRAWTIRRGATAPKAAGVIHTDFEDGFIRAETIAYDDYVALGGEQGAKEAGKMRLEGKDYVVADGDVMHFRFNV
ncbi:MAG: redox-regulated ATPase YchF, partial [Hyphococcus sp.]